MDLAWAVALGEDCLADIAMLRVEPAVFVRAGRLRIVVPGRRRAAGRPSS